MRSGFALSFARWFELAAGCGQKVIGNGPRSGRALAFVAALVFVVGAGSVISTAIVGAQDPDAPPHQPPSIVNFNATTDGTGMYLVSGSVVDCDDVSYLEVWFDDAGAGLTAMTDDFGDFYNMVYLPDSSGYWISATVTCREGLTSDPVYTVLP